MEPSVPTWHNRLPQKAQEMKLRLAELGQRRLRFGCEAFPLKWPGLTGQCGAGCFQLGQQR